MLFGFAGEKRDRLTLSFQHEQEEEVFPFYFNTATSIPPNTRTVEVTRTEDGKHIHCFKFIGSQTALVDKESGNPVKCLQYSVPEDHQLLGIELFSTEQEAVGLRVCSWRSPYRSDIRISNHERNISEIKLTPYCKGATCKQSHWLYYQTEAKAT